MYTTNDGMSIMPSSVDQLPPGLSLRRLIYAWLLDPNIKDNLRAKFDGYIAMLIIGNLLVMVFENVPGIYDNHKAWFHIFDLFSIAVFSIEYLLRLYLAPEDAEFAKSRFPRLRYVFSIYALIDLAAILPFYAALLLPIQTDLRMLRVLRLLRLFKLFRVLIPALREFKQLNRGRTFRQHVHALVSPSEFGGRLHEMFDMTIMMWVVISVVAVVLESVDMVYRDLAVEFVVLDAIAVSIFTAEYLMRLYSCVEDPRFKHWFAGRYRFATGPASVVDFLAIVPFFLEALLHHLFDLRFLRVFRLIRLMKLTRYTGATQTLYAAMKREWPVIGASAFIMMLLVVVAASLGYLFEHDAQPDKFENIPQSIYWSVITLASVGYGDISPVTPAGRAITVVLALLGIGIFAVPAAVLSSAFNDQLRVERETMQNELYKMLEDGKISEEEQHLIDREAARLHLSAPEVERIMERARQQRILETTGHGGIPFAVMQDRPAVALQQYRMLAGQLLQIAQLADRKQLATMLANPGDATDFERHLWQLIEAQGGSGKSVSSEANVSGT
jgi:voltage-gated potassium channel Kch